MDNLTLKFLVFIFALYLIIQENSCQSELKKQCKSPDVILFKLDENGTEILNTRGTKLSFDVKSYIKFLIICKHKSPIRWIVNEDLEGGELQQVVNYNEIVDRGSFTTRVITDFYDTSSYIYQAKYYLEIFQSTPQTFICQTFQNSSSNCDQTSVIGNKEGKFSNEYILRLATDNDTVDDSLGLAIVDPLTENSTGDCPFTLNIGLIKNSISLVFGWTPVKIGSSANIFYVENAQSLQNVELFQPQLEEKCITYLETDEEILNCTSCSQIEFDQHNMLPLVLTYTYGDNKRVLKIFFDTAERWVSFYYIWEAVNVNTQSLLSMKRESLVPRQKRDMKEFFKGEEIVVKCYSSVFLFSIGTQIAWKIQGANNSLNFVNVNEEEKAHPGGFFLTKGILRIDRDYLLHENVTVVETICLSPVWNTHEWVNKTDTFTYKDSDLPSFLYVNSTNSTEMLMVEMGKENFTIRCEATGIPLPNIEMIYPRMNLNLTTRTINENTSIVLEIMFGRMDTVYEGVYTCKAKSVVGETSRTFDLKVTPDNWSKRFRIIMMVCGICVALIFILLALILIVKLKREKIQFNRKTEEAIKKFHEGFSNSQDLGFKAQGEYKDFEIPLIRWGIGNTILGSGAFGIVQKGVIYHSDNQKSVVAVKTVNSPKDVSDFESSLLELTIMSYIGKHQNVVSLIGACTDNIGERRILIGVEYCANGDLLAYLRRYKTLFASIVVDGQIQLEEQHGDYRNLRVGNFCTLDLYKWAYQIANGMNYLRSKRIIHADLACRNILLTSDNVAKISDFGLSRQLITSDSYTKKTNMPLPWKWMAIESLQFCTWTIETDVWSYGVLLWEIFTLGAEPWTGCVWSNEFADELRIGRRLKRPEYGTENMYTNIMLECWRNEPDSRITFEFAKDFFEVAVMHLNSPEGKDDKFLNNVC